MLSRFFRRRTLWWPTPLGWLLLIALGIGPVVLWGFLGEKFLASVERQPAEVLVVEGWIGDEGIRAAQAEFLRGGYRFAVTTSGLSGESWSTRRWSYAVEAEEQLLRMGLPRNQVLLARPHDAEVQRTFESAVAVRSALAARGLQSASINLYTRGAHARRSRLVYAKVLGPGAKVGVVPWLPPGFEREPWWHSRDRSEDMVKETVGYLFELLLNSGRTSNSAAH